MTLPTGATPNNFFPSSGAWAPVEVAPGGYAVIGPGGSGGQTFIGFEAGQDYGKSTTRHLKIVPTNPVESNIVFNNTIGGASDQMPASQIKQPVQVLISEPLRRAASTTRTPSDMPEMIRFRVGKFPASTAVRIGNSDTSAPRSSATIRSKSLALSRG